MQSSPNIEKHPKIPSSYKQEGGERPHHLEPQPSSSVPSSGQDRVKCCIWFPGSSRQMARLWRQGIWKIFSSECSAEVQSWYNPVSKTAPESCFSAAFWCCGSPDVILGALSLTALASSNSHNLRTHPPPGTPGPKLRRCKTDAISKMNRWRN